MPASRSREGQGKGVVGGGPEPASRQATGQPGAETPVYNDFFLKPPLTVYKPTVQAHSPQRASQRHSLGVWEKEQQIPLAPPTPQPPPHLTSLEKGSEGAGHLRVSENLETALS